MGKMLRKNLLVLGIVIAVCMIMLIVGLQLNRDGTLSGLLPSASDDATDAADKASEPLYLAATVNGVAQEPVALLKEQDFTFTQEDGAVNTVHATESSIVMAHSNCKNQDCVKQGEVTLQNRESRFLGNMIICLPNRVTLELCTADELSRRITLE